MGLVETVILLDDEVDSNDDGNSSDCIFHASSSSGPLKRKTDSELSPSESSSKIVPPRRNRPPRKKPSLPRECSSDPLSVEIDIFDKSSSTLSKARIVNPQLNIQQQQPPSVSRTELSEENAIVVTDSDDETALDGVSLSQRLGNHPKLQTPPIPPREPTPPPQYIDLDRLLHSTVSMPMSAPRGCTPELSVARDQTATTSAVLVKISMVTTVDSCVHGSLQVRSKCCYPDLTLTLGDKDVFDKLLQQYAAQYQVPKALLIMIYRGFRLFPWSTPSTLEMGVEETVLIYHSKESFERLKQTENNLANVESVPSMPLAPIDASSIIAGQENIDELFIKLKVKDVSGRELKVSVRRTTILGTLIIEFFKKHPPINTTTNYKLFDPDGEEIDVNQTADDIGLGDEEMISIHTSSTS